MHLMAKSCDPPITGKHDLPSDTHIIDMQRWRGREERGAGKIRRDHRHGRTRAAGLNPPGGLRGPHPFTS